MTVALDEQEGRRKGEKEAEPQEKEGLNRSSSIQAGNINA